MTEYLASLDTLALYPALLFGLIVAGGLILIPALYLVLVGTIDLGALFILTLLAAAASDSFWYAIGLLSKKERLYSLSFVKKRIDEAKAFSAFYSKHGVRLVFLTKFVYGTRIASHVLAGMHKINYSKFLGATGAGTALWFWMLFSLVKILDVGITSAKATAFRIQILFLVSLGLLFLFNWFTRTYVKKKLMSRK